MGKLLETALAEINKDFGQGAIRYMSDSGLDIPRISIGNTALDMVLGGGVPRGCIAEFFGPEMSGKSTLGLKMVAEAQKLGLPCAVIDAENGMNVIMAEGCGVDMDSLLISQPDVGEDALEMVRKLVRTGEMGVIVVDSVAALTPRAELQGEIGDSHIGLQGRMMSQALRILSSEINKTDTILVFINQLREKIGVISYGDNTTTPGGRALKYYSDLRLDVRKVAQIKGKEGQDPLGHDVKIKVAKNRSAAPLQTVTLHMYYDRGISEGASLLDLGLERGLIKQSGSWFADTTTGEKLGQGKMSVIDHLDSDLEAAASLREAILAGAE